MVNGAGFLQAWRQLGGELLRELRDEQPLERQTGAPRHALKLFDVLRVRFDVLLQKLFIQRAGLRRRQCGKPRPLQLRPLRQPGAD
eukprot:CAMPEP_0176155450 /NCGR_PEP_ID=MMETSP0120_2-20121206/79439_1 /TAXON_ID=160619 /ORGANISM="Kryptoperidinium foliaceum, Strain CCMP 1326" /LENGTH=85 /DNA_ID=CAMNT_0017492611 /DNA_START=30 /DNA_END=284 /DNA_ORIENTATION=+